MAEQAFRGPAAGAVRRPHSRRLASRDVVDNCAHNRVKAWRVEEGRAEKGADSRREKRALYGA